MPIKKILKIQKKKKIEEEEKILGRRTAEKE